MNKIIKTGLVITIGSIIIFLLIPVFIYYRYRTFVYKEISSVPEGETLIVFGAAAYGPDAPSAPLKDRLEMAAQLYNERKVKKIILSGDGMSDYYDEPLTMFNTLVKLGIPEDIMIQDKYGLRTYDTCYRAKNTYKLDRVILVSQGYHLPRAIFSCRALGIDAAGVYAVGDFSSDYSRWNIIREIGAMYNAVLDVIVIHPKVNEEK